MELSSESLLAVPIRDDEIFELLERLAATEEMFKTPVSTIRDVAELTDASPNLIARILSEMRGPCEIEELASKVGRHEERIQIVEHTLRTVQGKAEPTTSYFDSYQQFVQDNQNSNEQGYAYKGIDAKDIWMLVGIAVVVITVGCIFFAPLLGVKW